MQNLIIKIGLVLLWAYGTCAAEEFTLRVPIIAEVEGSQSYYHELLRQALDAQGHDITIVVDRLPQKRVIHSLENSLIDMVWLLESEERNESFIPVDIGLTEGLIGQRIMLIRPEDQYLFDGVTTLAQFRDLGFVAALGQGWFDVNVWKMNKLAFKEQNGSWDVIYSMLNARRDYDYFPRGVNEVLAEVEHYPYLAIEKNLILQYERDFKFYLSKGAARHKETISDALAKARESGLMAELLQAYVVNNLAVLGYDQRTVIKLDTPD